MGHASLSPGVKGTARRSRFTSSDARASQPVIHTAARVLGPVIAALGVSKGSPGGTVGFPQVLAAPGCSQERHPPFTGGQTLLLGHQHPTGTSHAEPRAQRAERSTSWLRLSRKLAAVLSGGPL